MVTILFPSILSKVTEEKKTKICAKTLREAIDKMLEKYGETLREKMFEESGHINRYLRFYIKGRSTSELNELDASLSEEDEVVILVIIGGG